VNVEYIVPPRLVDSDGQLMQGDAFHGIPFAHLLPDSDTAPVHAAALHLTPTCDFALKGDHPERQVAPIEAVTDILAHAQTTLRELYAIRPADLPSQHQRLDEFATGLDKVGLVLQEAQLLQVTNALLRERGLSNILPR